MRDASERREAREREGSVWRCAAEASWSGLKQLGGGVGNSKDFEQRVLDSNAVHGRAW